MNSEIKGAFDPSMWQIRAEGGYSKLGWVNASEPLRKMVELADLRGGETVLDVGTGNQAVSLALKKELGENKSKFLGFDISSEMLSGTKEKDIPVFIANAYKIPLPDSSVDLVTTRMVYHHLEDPSEVVNESHRVLKNNGRLLVCEYVATDEEVWQFERKVFDIKEPSRNLWTGEQLSLLVKKNWPSDNYLVLDYAVMPQYSVRDWMGKSGLPVKIQESVLNCYVNAPDSIREKMNITYTEEGDALVDRPFGFVVAVK